MKRSLILVAFAMIAQPAFGSDADEYYKKGMDAVAKGDITGARTAFSETLRLKPDHAYARYQLGKLAENKGELISKRRSNELAAIKVPEVAFEAVTLSEALEALDHLVAEASKKADEKSTYSPNFMIRDPKNELGKREVSLRLKNVPAKVAFDYLLEQAGGVARYDEHAIVIRPAPQSASR
jgi:tetratricopeptide (TPR) repeat protein